MGERSHSHPPRQPSHLPSPLRSMALLCLHRESSQLCILQHPQQQHPQQPQHPQQQQHPPQHKHLHPLSTCRGCPRRDCCLPTHPPTPPRCLPMPSLRWVPHLWVPHPWVPPRWVPHPWVPPPCPHLHTHPCPAVLSSSRVMPMADPWEYPLPLCRWARILCPLRQWFHTCLGLPSPTHNLPCFFE